MLVSGAWESAPGVIVLRHIPTSFQTVDRPIGCRSVAIAPLLDYKNLFKAGLISEPEYLRRKEEEEEEEMRMAGGRAMTEATRRRLESRAPQKKKTSPSRPKTKPPRQAEGARHRRARQAIDSGREGWRRPS
ncbi:unnamed protein product [Prunus armeniaca]